MVLDENSLPPPIAKISSTERAENISPLPKPPTLEERKTIAARTKIEEAEKILAIAEKAHEEAQKMLKRSGKVDVETERGVYPKNVNRTSRSADISANFFD